MKPSTQARKPARRATPKPIREIVNTPKPFTNPRASAAAAMLKQTVVDPKGVPIPKGRDKDTPGGYIGVKPGDEAGPAGPREPQLPTPSDPTGKNLNEPKTTKAKLEAYATQLNGGKPLSTTDYANWSIVQKAQYAAVSAALSSGDAVSTALDGVPERFGNMIAELPYNLLRSLQGYELPEEPGPVRTNGDFPSHVKGQTSVGGTKGSPTIVDRSEALKKAWITRKKNYGSSGRK